ncbi:hypothetical protein [Candidatus Phyllobacterium onerii]|uniref:hypothetical protein n=1 Tax=Candidatus Phyllobacterium onerii TaxID=3020828 RepID=UPI00232FA7AE|nr:hypothetical protein [Phyllobacterium sp. IY22]
MTQVQDIEKSDIPPENEDWVLIEVTDGKFVASGSLTAIDGPAFFKPAPFETLDEAVTASLLWAEQNDVPFVYVRA